jgi:hypothetical protein
MLSCWFLIECQLPCGFKHGLSCHCSPSTLCFGDRRSTPVQTTRRLKCRESCIAEYSGDFFFGNPIHQFLILRPSIRPGFAWCCRIYLHNFYHGYVGKAAACLYSEVPMSTKGECSIILLENNPSWQYFTVCVVISRNMTALQVHDMFPLPSFNWPDEQRISILSVVSVKRIWRSLSLMLKPISIFLFWRGTHGSPFRYCPLLIPETVSWMLFQPLNWNQSQKIMCSRMK